MRVLRRPPAPFRCTQCVIGWHGGPVPVGETKGLVAAETTWCTSYRPGPRDSPHFLSPEPSRRRRPLGVVGESFHDLVRRPAPPDRHETRFTDDS